MTVKEEFKTILKNVKGHLKRLEEENIDKLHVKIDNTSRAKTPPHTKLTKREQLLELHAQVVKCRRCEELVRNRNSVVFGAGHANARLCFVGEAPGYEEDKQGIPFVGRAGQLLTKMIAAIGMTRAQVFICNVLKCRPPRNRNPLPDEILNCEPYLVRQLEIIQPRIICALGSFAAQTLLKTGQSVSRLRGEIHDYHGIPFLVTFHPAYLLRNPNDKRKAWEDMKKLKRELSK